MGHSGTKDSHRKTHLVLLRLLSFGQPERRKQTHRVRMTNEANERVIPQVGKSLTPKNPNSFNMNIM